jgi:hypothetical protein
MNKFVKLKNAPEEKTLFLKQKCCWGKIVLQAKLSFRNWKNSAQTNVVWLLEFGIYTCQLSTQVYTHQSNRGEIFEDRFWYRTLVLNLFEKYSHVGQWHKSH